MTSVEYSVNLILAAEVGRTDLVSIGSGLGLLSHVQYLESYFDLLLFFLTWNQMLTSSPTSVTNKFKCKLQNQCGIGHRAEIYEVRQPVRML